MTSEKQIQANRINALKGGVKTEEGKAIVRLNAVSYGFFSKEVLLPGEDARLMGAFREKLMAELQPQGLLETVLVDRIISSSWRLKRLLRSELKLYQNYSVKLNSRPRVDYRYSPWQNVVRYETTLERQIYKALHELERLQRARSGEPVPAPLAIDLAVSSSEEVVEG
jgi:hypothetical protein